VPPGACLDQCDSKSLRAVFGAPLPNPRHALAAAQTALELVRHLDEANRACGKKWNRTFDFRVGVNSGKMVAAAYGSPRLGAYGVAGKTVECARRLCAANPACGSRILIGSGALELLRDAVEARPLERNPAPPESEREEIYELLGMKTPTL
jgi:adenylate cyclase